MKIDVVKLKYSDLKPVSTTVTVPPNAKVHANMRLLNYCF